MREFRAPQTMTPAELGDSLARLVWESFSDFVTDGDADVPLADLGVSTPEGIPSPHATEEALIFLLWAHTRGAQQAFVHRAEDDLVKAGLDALHEAVFEDMVENGTPRAHLPIFEQRVAARYAEYHAASEISDARLGVVVARHLTGQTDTGQELLRAIRERAIAVANPLRDFLEEVELVEI